MNLSRHILLLPVCILLYTITAYAQPGFKVDIAKPEPYQERKLKSEKTGEGEMKAPKRIFQNLTTRYNYYFNASNKFNEIIESARLQHRDDYSQLLSFYSYDLNTTAADSAQLDSVIYKARTGIANHDLRNEWIDELYLLWAASMHLQQKFDSASMMLQFINYAYAPKYEDGYYKAIGTHTEGAKELSIATREEKKFLHSNTFSRNNAFLWQIRTLTEMEKFTTAGSLINTLRRDPAFPLRLGNGLDEVEAYWWYRQQKWDSAAVHLVAAIDGANTKRERARWTYLAAQLMEKAGKRDEAQALYEKVVSITPDPIMEVYARLNTVRLSKAGGNDATDKNLAELLRMAERDKYEEYRDIIYFMAAQMELERGNIAAASELMIKGSRFSTGDQASRNKAFLKIADVSYEQKKYLQAAQFYDSIQVAELPDSVGNRVNQRKESLQKVVFHSGVIYRQDSLQRIAALPSAEREAFVKALVKKLRKQQGLKEEAAVTSGGNPLPANTTNPAADMFSQQRGEWYFYNNTTKVQGAAKFKSAWGNRPNSDNWRRFAVVSQQQQALTSPDQMPDAVKPNTTNAGTAPPTSTELTVEGLTSHLPLAPETLAFSNDSIRNALYGLGTAYLNDVDDLPSAIATFEELRRRFPDNPKNDEVLFNLHYAYGKTGNQQAAAEAKRQLTATYPSSRFAAITSTGKDPLAANDKSAEATKAYEHVYNLFIEGRFAEAEKAKRVADSTYQTTYWEPQLLYIESVYYIRQRQDSVASEILQTIINQDTHKGLTAKAENLLNVLSRRLQIEEELRNLEISRPADDDTVAAKPLVSKPVVAPQQDTIAAVEKPAIDPAKDSAALALVRQKQISDSIAQNKLLAKQLRDSLENARKDSLLLVKQQQDEARKDSLTQAAVRQKQLRDSIALAKATEKRVKDSLESVKRDSLLFVKKQQEQAKKDSIARKALADKQRKDSIDLANLQAEQARQEALALKALEEERRRDSITKVKTAREQARKDSIALAQERKKQLQDSIALARATEKRIKDSLAQIKPPAPKPEIDPNAYYFEPDKPHYALVVLDKVDPIFVTEARTAFTRYNQETYGERKLNVQIVDITADTRMLLVSGLPTAAAAADYAVKAKEVAATEIVPWLTGNKYTFSIISARNLELLKAKTDVTDYKKFLEQHLPGKF